MEHKKIKMTTNQTPIQKVIDYKEILTPPSETNDKPWLNDDGFEDVIANFIYQVHQGITLDQKWMDFQDEASDNYKKEGWIENLSFEKTCSFLTLIVRKEKYSEGFVRMMLEDGTVARLLDRLENLTN